LGEDSKGLDVPRIVDQEDEPGDHDAELGGDETRWSRRIVALANYVAQGRPVVQVAVSLVLRDMSRPAQRNWTRLKRVGGQYLKKYPSVGEHGGEQQGEDGAAGDND
jgi:hypothetical protein